VNAPGESTPTTAVRPRDQRAAQRRNQPPANSPICCTGKQLRRTAETRRRQFSAQQRELQESEAFTHTILNSLTEHLAVLDADGVIVSVNRAWQHFALEKRRTGAGGEFARGQFTGRSAWRLPGNRGVMTPCGPGLESRRC
jgi:PAS domain-containing protein